MIVMAKLGLNTQGIHAGQEFADKSTGARAVPIYQTTSFVFETPDEAAELFSLKKFGNIYTRITNPTTEAFERRVSAIEGGTASVALASGQAAISLATLSISEPGDNFVSGSSLYGGTYELFHYTFPKLGRSVKFVETSKPEEFEAAIDTKTKGLYVETIGNPKLDVPDFDELSKVADEAQIPLIVDNTVGIGIVKPIEYGAKIIVSSATKYIGGHGTSIGGVVTDSGLFDWSSGKFPSFTEPDPSYHSLKFYEAFGNIEGIGNIALAVKIRTQLLRDLGPCLSPFNAFLFLQGLETLRIRQERHSKNAMEVAKYLRDHRLVSWVTYPGLDNHPTHRTARKYLKENYGGLVGFGIKGGLEAGKKFINSLRLFSHLANIGDSKSLVVHPASTTHQQLTPEERLSSGVTDDYIRLSVGLEDIEDIIEDIDQALQKTDS